MSPKSRFSQDPHDPSAFTKAFDHFYTRFAQIYDMAVRHLPVWATWLHHVLPHLKGPRILEIAFGTGYLMTRYAGRFEVTGVDINARMVATTRSNLAALGLNANLMQARVEALPLPDAAFDTVLCTMAFSGFPDARAALSEMLRVLKEGGRLILLDVNYPADKNWKGRALVRVALQSGDLIRDMRKLLTSFNLVWTDEEVGGAGGIHLYVATKV